MIISSLLLLFAGLASGFVDSIAGGGALISIPSLTLFLGAGPSAVGTSKIAGTLGTFIATSVYFKKGHLNLRASLFFALTTACGSVLGSQSAPLVPPQAFRWILLISCPLILWLVWRKDLWLERKINPQGNIIRLGSCGLICGFYDGLWGPGSGTFMLLSLLFFADMPLLMAMAASKLAGFFSASTALLNYSLGGFVDLSYGLFVALGFGLGAFIGASLTARKGIQIARPVLVVLSGLLLIRAFF